MQHPAEIYEIKYRGPAGQTKRLALWHREVLKLLETFNKEQRLLEVGCGNGRLLAAIVELGFDAVGIDVSSEAIARCREKGLKAECVDVSEGIPYEGQYLQGESPSQIQNPLHIRFFAATYLSEIALLQGFNVMRMYSPVQRFRWAKMIFQKLKLRPQWEALTRRWGKTLFAVLEKVAPPRYADLAQVREPTKKW